jgi:hypothetical protein
MSIINVVEDWRERRSIGDVKSGGQEYRVFTVLFDEGDNPIIRPCLAKNAPGVPIFYETHPSDPYCYVQNKTAEAVSPFMFKVTVQYGYAEGAGGAPDVTNPLEQPDLWSTDFEVQNVPVDSAYAVGTLFGTAIGDVFDSGDDPKWPIVNSAGEYFDQPITEQFYDIVKRCVCNRSGWNDLFVAEYIGTINNQVWKGWPAFTARLSRWSHEQLQAGDLIYYRHSLEFRIRWDGWLKKTLDTGYNEVCAVDSGHPDGLTAIQRDGIDITTPARLDGTGHVLTPGNSNVYRCFRTVRTRDFNNINV